MRRGFYTPRYMDEEGSQRSNELAVALAQIADPDFLQAVIRLKSFLDGIGGQAYVVAFRNKYDPISGEEVTDASAAGRHETEGYAFHYEHIARLSGQDPEKDSGAADTIAGLQEAEGWEGEGGAVAPEKEDDGSE